MAESERCREARRELGRPPEARSAELAEHRASCPRCAEDRAGEAALDRALAGVRAVELPSGLEDRLDEALAQLEADGDPAPLPWAWIVGLLFLLGIAALAPCFHKEPAIAAPAETRGPGPDKRSLDARPNARGLPLSRL